MGKRIKTFFKLVLKRIHSFLLSDSKAEYKVNLCGWFFNQACSSYTTWLDSKEFKFPRCLLNI